MRIVDLFPGITLAGVYAGPWRTILTTGQEIEDEFQKDEQWAEWLKTNVPSKIPARAEGPAG